MKRNVFYIVSHPNSQTLLDDADVQAAEDCDCYNKPRLRSSLIVSKFRSSLVHDSFSFLTEHPQDKLSFTDVYQIVHNQDLLKFLQSAWQDWVDLGDARDEGNFHPAYTISSVKEDKIPPLVPSQMPLHRDKYTQRAGKNVMGSVGYFCTDLCTPIVASLVNELDWDAAIMMHAIHKLFESAPKDLINGAYAITTHPGHHASYDSYGGYCHLNHVAMAAKYLQRKYEVYEKVAILDIDYHAGNGTASIFYTDPSVLVISIHCDPDVEYPFNSGWADQIGAEEGIGTTLNLPLPPGTTFSEEYRNALRKAMDKIVKFGASALVVSLGLDTRRGDEVAVRRAGFDLYGKDYWHIVSLCALLFF